jgi:chromosome partitioning protein
VTTAALSAANFALIAFQTESLALRSVGQALTVIEHVQATRNPRLRLVGILPTLVERDRAGSHGVLSEIWNGFPDALETVVPRSESFVRASALGNTRGLPRRRRRRTRGAAFRPAGGRDRGTDEPPRRHGEGA